MDEEQRLHFEELLRMNRRRLRPLERRAALYGVNTPPEVLIEIEDIRAEIDNIEALLRAYNTKLPTRESQRIPYKSFSDRRWLLLVVGLFLFIAALWFRSIIDQRAASPTNPVNHPTTLAINDVVTLTERIAFQTNRDGNFEIYTINSEGDRLKNLTLDPAGDYSPAWSYDGKHIAFVSDRYDDNNEILMMDANGGNVKRLTTNDVDDGVPTWSPDGRIAFQSNYNSKFYNVYVMKTTGSNIPIPLTGTTPLTGQDYENRFPTWSPNGQKIAFISNRDNNWRIYLMNPDGSDQKRLTTHEDGDEFGPAWSPDGKQIAFLLEQDRKRDIYIINADGSGMEKLINTPDENEGVLTWSADGQRLAFQVGDDPDNRAIFIINVDGTGREALVEDGESSNYFPAWSPPVR